MITTCPERFQFQVVSYHNTSDYIDNKKEQRKPSVCLQSPYQVVAIPFLNPLIFMTPFINEAHQCRITKEFSFILL